LVCRLCGAANPPQQTGCTVCGSPLERAPDRRRGPAASPKLSLTHALWMLLSAAVGAVLGLLFVRARAGGGLSAGAAWLGVLLGAGGGVALGLLPGPAARLLRRGSAAIQLGLCQSLARRRCARIRAECEQALEAGEAGPETHLRLAGVHWLERRREAAERALRTLLDGSDGASLARHNLAVCEAEAGRWARAVEDLEQARQHLPDSGRLLWNLGIARWRLGQLDRAAAALRELIAREPGHEAGRSALAIVLARQGDIKTAVSELEALLRERRRVPDVLCTLGVVQQSRGELDLAAGSFTAALARDPAHIAARYNRGLCAMLYGRYHEALEDLWTVADLAPEHAWALVQSAICHYRLGQRRRALEAVRRALRAGPNDFQVRYNAGTLLLREGVVSQAVSHLERAYELNPRSLEVVVNLGVASYLSGQLRHALDHFRAGVRMDSRHALARYNCAVCFCMLDLLEEAEAQVAELLQLYPEFPEAFNAIGVIRLLQNRLVEAAEQFRRTADAMPRSAVARSNLALTYYIEGDLAAAADQARQAVALDPGLAAARDIAGHAALELGNLEEAIEHFRALTKLEPTNPDAHSNLGLAYYKDDRLNEAVECYQRALIFSPESPEGHNDLGLAYAKNKMLEEATSHLARVIEARPDNPIVHSNMGLVSYFRGQTERAVQEWREVTRLSPAYARSREATRFSAYDDQEMIVRPLDRRKRALQFPLKVAPFRHSFQLPLDEDDLQMELPWPDLAAVERLLRRARAARRIVAGP